MKTISSFLVISCFVAAVACNSQTPAEEESMDAALEAGEVIDPDLEHDTEFAREMAERNLLEIQLGQLAEAKSASGEVKELAKQMVTEHQTANKELKAWANPKGFMLTDELSEKSQKIYDGLAAREGTDFDEAYSDYLVTSHKQDLRKLERETEKGNDPDLKKWAAEKIPVWTSHLHMAEQAEDTADEKD